MKLITTTIALITAMLSTCAARAGNDAATAAPSDSVTVILGDSNIWLAGDSCDNHQGWVAWLRDMRRMPLCTSYARSGASWSHTCATTANTTEDIAILGDNNVIYNQVLRLREAVASGRQQQPSLILVSAGGNDAWFASKRPHEFDLTVDQAFATPDSTLLGLAPCEILSLPQAIRYCSLMLRQSFPHATIVLLTPMQMAKVEPEMMQRVSSLIDASATRLGLPVIRLDGDEPISRTLELETHVNTYDGTHTSEKGAQKVAAFVNERLDSILTAPSPLH